MKNGSLYSLVISVSLFAFSWVTNVASEAFGYLRPDPRSLRHDRRSELDHHARVMAARNMAMSCYA